MIYLDHAATSFPKPREVIAAVAEYLTEKSANPGRSGHRLSVQAARVIYESREALASLLGVADSRRVLFAASATTAINAVLHGFVRPGDHVIATSLEHNAVARPLRQLHESRDVKVTIVPADSAGHVRISALADAVRPETRLAVVTHASNVTGAITPLPELRQALAGVPLLIDAAQTAGAVPLAFDELGIEFLAFTGHKSLLGPQGTGGLCVKSGVEFTPLVQGGTGSRSESDEMPDFLPDRHECGTPNGPGIAGLGAGARLLLARGIDVVRAHERSLLEMMLAGLAHLDGVTIHGAGETHDQLPIVSLRVAGLSPKEVAFRLDRGHEIMVRAGLHCAPFAHRTIGTYPEGTVRFAAGYSNTEQDIEAAVAAVAAIAREARA